MGITTKQRLGMAKLGMARWQRALGRARQAWDTACDQDLAGHDEQARIDYCVSKIRGYNILISNLETGLA